MMRNSKILLTAASLLLAALLVGGFFMYQLLGRLSEDILGTRGRISGLDSELQNLKTPLPPIPNLP